MAERQLGTHGGKAGPGRGKKTSDNITRLYGNSAEYLTARLKSVSDAIELARANKDSVQGRRTDLGLDGDSIKLERGTTNTNILRRLARDYEEDRELHGLLVKHRPSTNGSNQHQKRVVNNVNNPPPKRAMGNTRAYIEQRLQAGGYPASYYGNASKITPVLALP